MNFKKNNINIKKKNNILNIFWFISILLVILIAIIIINNLSLVKIEIDKDNILQVPQSQEEDEESTSSLIKDLLTKKDSSINILLTWRWWWDHDAPDLTDTIILAKIDIENKVINLLSIPRDLYVEYDDEYGTEWKINWIFQTNYYRWKTREESMFALEKKITQITWEQIDYFVNIDFNWFKDIIDTIWWVTITVPEDFVDYEYPDWNWWYKTLFFKEWTWIFDWENALKYVRSRHSTSDFDRSLRQQQVIKAIKDKLTSSFLLTSPSKIKDLYDVFNDNVYTDISLTKVIKLAYSLGSNQDEYTIISSNINDSCFYWSSNCTKWWILYIPSREYFDWMSVLLIEWTDTTKLSNYEVSKEYADVIFNYPKVNTENYVVNIFNSLKVNNLAWELSNNVTKYWFNIPPINSIWNTLVEYPESLIYYNNISEDSQTIELLKKFYKGKFIKLESPKYSTDNAQIEIIIWRDYLWEEKVFNF